MPFRTVSSARKSIPSLKGLSDKEVKKFISVFNSLVKEGKSESEAIPIAIESAKKVEKNNMEEFNKALTNTIRMILQEKIREKIGNSSVWVSDYDLEKSLVYFEVYSDTAKYFKTSFSTSDGEIEISEDFIEVVRVDNYVEKNNKENNLVDKIISAIDKHFGGTKREDRKVIKSLDEELKQVTHVVYQPNVPDLHGEYMTEDTIRKACHSFNQHCRKANLFHRVETDKVEIVESYILPVDAEINGVEVKKGTWLAVLQYKDDELWEMEKSGEIQGISIGARGRVEQ